VRDFGEGGGIFVFYISHANYHEVSFDSTVFQEIDFCRCKESAGTDVHACLCSFSMGPVEAPKIV